MIKPNKQTLLCFSLLLMAASAKANLSDQQLLSKYQAKYPKLNICQDFKTQIKSVRKSFQAEATSLGTYNSQISALQLTLTERQDKLDVFTEQIEFNSAEITRLEASKTSDMALRIQQAELTLATQSRVAERAQSQLAQAQANLRANNCTMTQRIQRCRGLQVEVKKFTSLLNRANQSIETAQATISNLTSIDDQIADLVQANRRLNGKLLREQRVKPTMSSLEADILALERSRDANSSNYKVLEAQYGLLLVKLDQCQSIKRAVKQASTFKSSLPLFVDENNCELRFAQREARRYKSQAKKAGVMEAYSMMCETGDLIRVIEAPSTCEQLPTGPQMIRIDTFFSSNISGEQNYRNDLRRGKEKTHTLHEPGAQRIKLDIEYVDIEWKEYDTLTIQDQDKNVIAVLSNPSQGNPLGAYSTGWVIGDTLHLTFKSDGSTTRSGFKIDHFWVEK